MKYIMRSQTKLRLCLFVNVVCLVNRSNASTAYEYASELFNDTGSQQAAIYAAYCRQACTEKFRELYSETKRNENCRPCYCDDSCKIHDDCCPDLFPDDDHEGGASGESCKSVVYPDLPDPTDVKCSDRVYCDGDESYFEHSSNFKLVSDCPEDSDKDLKTACEESTKLPRSERHAPVTDLKTNLSYFSEPCAYCNKVQQFKKWSISFICRGQLPKSFGNTYKDFYNNLNNTKSCFRLFQPPAESSARVCFQQQVISNCNVTGKWTDKTQNSLLADCKKGLDLPVKQYNNIFCYLCSEDSTWSSIRNDYKRHVHYEDSYSVLDIIVTLNDALTEETEETSYQIFEPYKLKCRDVECKDGKMLINGTCHSIGNYGNQYRYSICLDVHDIVSKDKVTARDWCQFYRIFYNEHFYNNVSALGFKDAYYDCKVYYLNACDNDIKVTVELQTDVILEYPDDQDEKVEKLYRFLESRNGKLPFNGRNVDVKTMRGCIKSDYQEQGSDETCNTIDIRNSRVRLSPARYTNIISHTHHLSPTKLRFCPFVTLEESEGKTDADSQSLTILNTNRTLGLLEYSVVGDGRFEVCLEDYLGDVDLSTSCSEDDSTGGSSPINTSPGCYLPIPIILITIFICILNL